MFSLNVFLKKHKSNLTTEILAALTTFFTMAYILVVNPSILGAAGLPPDAVFTATALAAGFGCIIMGFLSNKPLAVACGMGENAYFAYTVVIAMGIAWPAALAAVFVAAALIFIIAYSKIDISQAMPESLKHAIVGALGLFLVFIGLQNAHFVVPNSATIVALGDLTQPITHIGLISLAIILFLMARGFKGAIFVGIVLTTIIAILVGYSPVPQGIFGFPPSPDQILFKIDFSALAKLSLLPVIWTIFILSFFDTLGSNLALISKTVHIHKSVKNSNTGAVVPGFRKALEADGIAGMLAALFGVSSVITFLESATGIQAGGKTGITAIGVGILFLFALFFFPLIKAIPIEAAAPGIIIVGLLMLGGIDKIKYSDET